MRHGRAHLFLLLALLGASAYAEHDGQRGLGRIQGKAMEGLTRSFVSPSGSGKVDCDGTEGNGLDPAVEAKLVQGAYWKVPFCKQTPGTCGFAALKMVMHMWHNFCPRNANPPLYDRKEANCESREPIFECAKRNGWMYDDGLTWHTDLKKTGMAYDYKVTAQLGIPTLSGLREALQTGPVIVSVRGTNEAGMPCNEGWTGGHWVIIEGFVEHEGKEYVIAQHGSSEGKARAWPLDLFYPAWRANGKATCFVTPQHVTGEAKCKNPDSYDTCTQRCGVHSPEERQIALYRIPPACQEESLLTEVRDLKMGGYLHFCFEQHCSGDSTTPPEKFGNCMWWGKKEDEPKMSHLEAYCQGRLEKK